MTYWHECKHMGTRVCVCVSRTHVWAPLEATAAAASWEMRGVGVS